MKVDKEGFETNEDIVGFTVTDEDVQKLLKAYNHKITLVVFMGNVDDAPAFGVKVAGASKKELEAGKRLGDLFMEYLKQQFEGYVRNKKG